MKNNTMNVSLARKYILCRFRCRFSLNNFKPEFMQSQINLSVYLILEINSECSLTDKSILTFNLNLTVSFGGKRKREKQNILYLDPKTNHILRFGLRESDKNCLSEFTPKEKTITAVGIFVIQNTTCSTVLNASQMHTYEKMCIAVLITDVKHGNWELDLCILL